MASVMVDIEVELVRRAGVKQRIANCPACGGPIEFQLSTALVTVCDFCHSVVARTDKSLEDHGKVADLVETNSPIKRGSTGQFEKKNFEVVGRVQYQHPAGGVWDEWYLKFPGDRVKWLAEAQGKYYVTAQTRLNDDASMPDFDSFTPGQRFRFFHGKTFVVAEKGIATARSAIGDIPWAFRPNAEHRFVDLNGPENEFGTIEFEPTGPRVFLGREVSIGELGLSDDGWESTVPPSPNTTVVQVNCPQCAAPLTLHAPDQTLRVCCPSCKALLDCDQGKLQYLQTLTMRQGDKPLIPLGATGLLMGVDFTVIGFMVRYIVAGGKKYPWSEYLLFNPASGFRWLVCSKGHWSFVEPVPVSRVNEVERGVVIFEDKRFRIYDKGTAHVSYVVGEFYWRVTVEEQVETTDYIDPPCMLSFERSKSETGEELNISLGTYIRKEILESAFRLKELPTAWGVGAIQPANRTDDDVFTIWPIFAVVLLVLDIILSSGFVARPVSQFHFFVALAVVSAWPVITLIGRHNFEVQRWQDSDFSPYPQGDSDE